MEITENKKVKIHYKGTFSDGKVFDSSEGKEPLEFVFGKGQVIPGLEKGIKGLSIEDKKRVEIKAEDAYGPIMKEAIQEVPKERLPQGIEIKPGMQLGVQGPQGVIPVTISEIKDDTVMIDFNHPLAGKDLIFDVEIVDVSEGSQETSKSTSDTKQEGESLHTCSGCDSEECRRTCPK